METIVLNEYNAPHMLGHSATALENILPECYALANYFKTYRVGIDLFEAYKHRDARNSISFVRSSSDLVSRFGAIACGTKSITRSLLERADVPIAKGRRFSQGEMASARNFARKIGWPVVVKPIGGGGGRGVTTGITSFDEFDVAVRSISGSFLVEKHVAGEDYRFLVIGGRVRGVIRRTPAAVIGNGVDTISELIDQKNILRNTNPHLNSRPIKKDSVSQRILKRQDFTFETVLKHGETAFLRDVCNISQGGDPIDITNEVHPTLNDLAVRAAAQIPGIEHCGLDILIEDFTQPLFKQQVNICEINSSSGNSLHHYPIVGTPRDVVGDVFNLCMIRKGYGAIQSRDIDAAARVEILGFGDLEQEHLNLLEQQSADIGVNLDISASADERFSGVVTGSVSQIAAVLNILSRLNKTGVVSGIEATRVSLPRISGRQKPERLLSSALPYPLAISAQVATITHFEAVLCRIPFKLGFKTSRRTATVSSNYILGFRLEDVLGVGEASPRSLALTGDTVPLARGFFDQARDVLIGAQISKASPAAALADLRRIMGDLETLAGASGEGKKRFRASLAGIDMMLLDGAARLHGLTVAEFLGRQRPPVGVTALTLSAPSQGGDKLLASIRRQLKRYPACRAKGGRDTALNLEVLRGVTTVAREMEMDKIAWLDMNEAYPPEDVPGLLEAIAESARAGDLRGTVILEQPVAKRYATEMCAFQKLADDLSAGLDLDLILMADESLWDIDDLHKLQAHGGCHGINIKVQKCGGLLKAVEIADAAMAFDPKTRIYIGGMIGTSDLTSRALLSLAEALPQFDFITSGPRSNIEAHIVTAPLKWTSSSNVLDAQNGPGLGLDLDWETLRRYCPAEEDQARLDALQRNG